MKELVCLKPWGEEYVIFRSEQVAVWFLKIKPGESTSLHSHPDKITSLLVLSGAARLSFLNDASTLNAFDKRIIRRGVFHGTENIGEDDLYVIETECPVDKNNLLRLKDKYGRKGKPYEGLEHHISKEVEFVFDQDKVNFFKEYSIYKRTLYNEDYLARFKVNADTKVLILNGMIHDAGIAAASIGDLLEYHTLTRLSNEFAIQYPFEMMVFERHTI